MKELLRQRMLFWLIGLMFGVNIGWVIKLNRITNEIATFSTRNFDSTENTKGILNHINIALCKEYPNKAISFVRQVPRVEYDEYIRNKELGEPALTGEINISRDSLPMNSVIFNCDKTLSNASRFFTNDITIGNK